MTDLHKALLEIHTIRGQIARGTEFRGYGPATLGATGGLALLAALLQGALVPDPAAHVQVYLAIWVTTAALSLTLIGVETILRARRLHSGFAYPMLQAAVEAFAPAIVSGLLLTVVIVRSAPGAVWMLPGLWQVIFSLGAFASCRFLPRATFGVGIWYLGCGLMYLALGPASHGLSPWSMGLPFGIGQLLVAGVLFHDDRFADE